MPYRDRAQQLQAMRDWRARQKAQRRGETRQPAGAHNPNLVGSTPAPATTSASSTSTSTPTLPRSPAERTSHRRHLLDTYTRLRDAGHTDATAQAQLTQQRDQRQRQAQLDAHEREVERLAPSFTALARARLSQCGSYDEADVLPAAHALAERSLWKQQPPRQADPPMKQLPAPGYRPPGQPLGQPALPIATGQVKHPAGNHLGQLPPLSPTEGAVLVAEAVRRVQARQPSAVLTR